MALIVKKFGGATLETTEKIARIATRIQEQKNTGDDLVIVVSAMGDTTDRLLRIAHELSDEPPLRDVDALLNTGEMISQALLSISLNSKNCPAIGLCGHQAGIRTDQFFSNASISEINPSRIQEALAKNQVVVVAGFQGQTPSGDLTTLGRGGSDTTALALAASLGADRCEILKDVPAVFSADPRLIPDAQPIRSLSYDQLLEMTYWGAKVLQYRSVEIAKHFQILLYVGPAHKHDLGTIITEKQMIEDSEVLALNSHETILQIGTGKKSLNEAVSSFKAELEGSKIPFPQLLHSELMNGSIDLFVTGPKEVTEAILVLLARQQQKRPVRVLSSVTATCRGSTRPETMEKVIMSLETKGIEVVNLLVSAMSVTVFVEKTLRVSALQLLHNLIEVAPTRAQLVSVT
jgi:aspartate kinase